MQATSNAHTCTYSTDTCKPTAICISIDTCNMSKNMKSINTASLMFIMCLMCERFWHFHIVVNTDEGLD